MELSVPHTCSVVQLVFTHFINKVKLRNPRLTIPSRIMTTIHRPDYQLYLLVRFSKVSATSRDQ